MQHESDTEHDPLLSCRIAQFTPLLGDTTDGPELLHAITKVQTPNSRCAAFEHKMHARKAPLRHSSIDELHPNL